MKFEPVIPDGYVLNQDPEHIITNGDYITRTNGTSAVACLIDAGDLLGKKRTTLPEILHIASTDDKQIIASNVRRLEKQKRENYYEALFEKFKQGENGVLGEVVDFAKNHWNITHNIVEWFANNRTKNETLEVVRQIGDYAFYCLAHKIRHGDISREYDEIQVNDLLSIASNSIPEASIELACKYYKLQEFDKMMAPLNQAIKFKVSEAYALMGYRFLYGEGIDPDPVKAVEWFMRIANEKDQDETVGCTYLNPEWEDIFSNGVWESSEFLVEILTLCSDEQQKKVMQLIPNAHKLVFRKWVPVE